MMAAMVEQERQRLEQLTAGWDDPTQVDWGPEEGDAITGALEGEVDVVQPPPTVNIMIEPGQIYKCIALYNYTVSLQLHTSIRMRRAAEADEVRCVSRHRTQMNSALWRTNSWKLWVKVTAMAGYGLATTVGRRDMCHITIWMWTMMTRLNKEEALVISSSHRSHSVLWTIQWTNRRERRRKNSHLFSKMVTCALLIAGFYNSFTIVWYTSGNNNQILLKMVNIGAFTSSTEIWALTKIQRMSAVCKYLISVSNITLYLLKNHEFYFGMGEGGGGLLDREPPLLRHSCHPLRPSWPPL